MKEKILDYLRKFGEIGAPFSNMKDEFGIAPEQLVATLQDMKYDILVEEYDQGWWRIAEYGLMATPLDYFDGPAFVPKLIGDTLLRHFNVKTILENGVVYVYANGVYKDVGEQILKNAATVLLGHEANSHRVNEAIFYVKNMSFVPAEKVTENKEMINLKNGIYDLVAKKLFPHSPEYFFVSQIPVNYSASEDCPKFKQFLSQVINTCDILIMQELFGDCLWRDYNIHKAFLFLGEGANGKSTLLNVLSAFLGKQNVASISLQDIDMRQFAPAYLYGKLANIYADLPDIALYHTGKFKILTGGDSMTAEKKFRDSFTFFNYAKFIFSTNKVPRTSDDTDAFFRRWIFINFPNRFIGPAADKTLIAKLTTDNELSGIFNWAIEGLERLMTNGDFSYSVTIEETRLVYQRLASPVAAFAQDCLETDAEAKIVKADLYEVFIGYCKKNNIPTMANNSFARELIELFPNIRSERTTTSVSHSVPCWHGIKLIESEKTDLDENVRVREREGRLDEFM